MTNQREHVAVEALRNIAKHDPHGESGKMACEALKHIEQIDQTHMQQQTGYDREKEQRLQNMAASRLGVVGHNPKTLGPMSPQEIEMGPGNMAQKTVNWGNLEANLRPQTPEAYQTTGFTAPGNATHEREQREKLDEEHRKNREKAQEQEDREREKNQDKQSTGQHSHQPAPPKDAHNLTANNLTVDKVGGGLDEGRAAHQTQTHAADDKHAKGHHEPHKKK